MTLADTAVRPDLMALETEYGARNYKPLDVILTRGEGVHVWDVDGRRYIDFAAGIAVLVVGRSGPDGWEEWRASQSASE